MASYPHLDHFLGAYMHQDWRLFGNTFEEIFDSFVADTPVYDLLQMQAELQKFLDCSIRHDEDYRALYPNGAIPPNGVTEWFKFMITAIEETV